VDGEFSRRSAFSATLETISREIKKEDGCKTNAHLSRLSAFRLHVSGPELLIQAKFSLFD
jgi:hypothetical protein